MGTAITSSIQQSVWNEANNVSIYVASKIREYTVAPSFKSEYEVHHIVAETHSAAAPARHILAQPDVNIDVNGYLNLVPIKTGVHKHLHTNIYFAMVNTYVINAYYVGLGSSRLSNVTKALNQIRVFLHAISNGAPF